MSSCGFDEDESLTLGKALAGLNAQTKGRSLGIFKPHEEKQKKTREKERDKTFRIELCGRPVPAKNTDNGIRADVGHIGPQSYAVLANWNPAAADQTPQVMQAMRHLGTALAQTAPQ